MEKFSQPEEKPLDFTCADDITRVLESGTPDQIEALRQHTHTTPEQIEFYRYYARLRRDTIQHMSEERKERLTTNPAPTAEEVAMGCFVEDLEPQVRNAVLLMRRKGYNTFISGFWGQNTQSIGFDQDYLKGFTFPQTTIDQLKNLHITEKISPNRIVFETNEYLDLNTLQKAWDIIADALPDRGAPAPDAQVGTAQDFRKKNPTVSPKSST